MEIDIGPLEPSGFATAQTGEEEEEQEVARHFVGKGTDRQVPVSKLVVGNDSSAGMDAVPGPIARESGNRILFEKRFVVITESIGGKHMEVSRLTGLSLKHLLEKFQDVRTI